MYSYSNTDSQIQMDGNFYCDVTEILGYVSKKSTVDCTLFRDFFVHIFMKNAHDTRKILF